MLSPTSYNYYSLIFPFCQYFSPSCITEIGSCCQVFSLHFSPGWVYQEILPFYWSTERDCSGTMFTSKLEWKGTKIEGNPPKNGNVLVCIIYAKIYAHADWGPRFWVCAR